MAKSRNRKLADLIVTAGVDIAGNVTFDGGSTSADLTFADGDKANFGDASDLKLYHTANHSYIENGTGTLFIDAAQVNILDGANTAASFTAAGATTLYNNGSPKLVTTSTGVNVTGITTSDTLVLEGTDVNTTYFTGGDASVSGRQLTLSSEAAGGQNNATHRLTVPSGYGSFNVTVNAKERVKINNNGDISFYNDASSNAVKMFWDASAESLGIGTSSASTPLAVHNALNTGQAIVEFRSTGNSHSTLDLRADGTGDPRIHFDLNGATPFALGVDNSDGDKFKISGGNQLGTNDRFVIDSSGNVGIGQPSPSFKLHVKNTNTQIAIESTTTNQNSSLYYIANGASQWETGVNITAGLDYEIYDRVNNASRMVVEHTGNVGIGTASPSRLLTLENNSSTVTNNSQLRINNIGAGDAYIYLFAGSDWSLGIDNSDSDKFKLCTTNDVSDGNEVLTVDRNGNVGIGTAGAAKLRQLDLKNTSHSLMAISAGTGCHAGVFYYEGTAEMFNQYYDNSSDKFILSSSAVANQFVIDRATGNVGIGQPSPGAKLHVVGPGRFDNSASTSVRLHINNSGSNDYASIYADTASAYKNLIINPNGGNVGIGTDNPATQLQVAGTGILTLGRSGINGTITSPHSLILKSVGSGEVLRYYQGSAEVFGVYASGKVGVGTDTPLGKLHVRDGTAQAGISHTYIYDGTAISMEATEPSIQLMAEDSGTHGGSLLWRYGNNTFAAIANPTTDAIDFTYGVTTANDFQVHSGTNMSSYLKIMSIGADGNVGIGTDTPGATLHTLARSGTTGLLVQGAASNNVVHFARSDGVQSLIINSDGKTILRRSGSAGTVLIFEAGAAQAGGVQVQSTGLGIGGGAQENQIFLKTDGNVGIGTTNPSNAKLEVVSTSGEVFRADSASGAYRIVANQTGVNMQGTVSVAGKITASVTDSEFHNRLFIKNGTHGLYMGQWDTVNHRIEADANRPLTIQSYNSGGITLGISGNPKFVVTNAGVSTPAKLAVMASAPHGSYDFYNNGTSYFNGATVVDDHLSITGTNAQLTLSRTSTDQTAGFNITNNQNGGYGSGIVWNSKRTDAGVLTAAEITVSGENAWNSDATSSSMMQFATRKDNTLKTHMTIRKSGNVGIGNSNPYFPLVVQGATGFNGEAKNNILAFDTASATTGTGGGIAFGGYSNGTGGDIYHFGNIQGIKENSTAGNYASALLFSTRAAGATPLEQMRINSTGNVGIGTDNPGYKLTVNGDFQSLGMYSYGSTSLGGNTDSRTDQTTLGGFGVLAGDGNRYGNYGSIAFRSSGNYTGSARAYLITNGYGANKFAIIQGSNSTTIPDISGTGGGANNGTPRFLIDHSGLVGIGTTNPQQTLQVDGVIRINNLDLGGSPADTAIMEMYGYESRGVGIRLRDSVNSASGASNREWFVGTGYNTSSFGIGYASDGSQSSYNAQNKLTVGANGDVGIGTTGPQGKLHVEVSEGNAGFVVGTTSSTSTNSRYQVITCANVLATSDTWYDVAYLTHSPTIDVLGRIIANNAPSQGGAGVVYHVVGMYGSVTAHQKTYQLYNNTSTFTNFEYRYLNSGASSGSYRLQVKGAWTNASHNAYVYTTIRGMADGTMYEDN